MKGELGTIKRIISTGANIVRGLLYFNYITACGVWSCKRFLTTTSKALDGVYEDTGCCRRATRGSLRVPSARARKRSHWWSGRGGKTLSRTWAYHFRCMFRDRHRGIGRIQVLYLGMSVCIFRSVPRTRGSGRRSCA